MVPAAISVTNETKPLTIWWHAQSIADTIWRLHRIPALEAAIFARGHVEFAEAFNDHDPSLRSSMIELRHGSPQPDLARCKHPSRSRVEPGTRVELSVQNLPECPAENLTLNLARNTALIQHL